jgi:hypothetical protein
MSTGPDDPLPVVYDLDTLEEESAACPLAVVR